MTSRSAPISATGSMPFWLKSVLVSAIVIAGCWGGVILFWRSTERTPGTWELGLLLLGLPLAVLTSLWLVLKLLTQGSTAKANTVPEANTSLAMTSTAPTLAILAAALRTPHGGTAAEVSTAVLKKKSSADIENRLQDADGYPVLAAVVRDSYDDSLQESMAEWLVQSGDDAVCFNDEQWRAITLAASVAGDLGSAASQLEWRVEHPTLHIQLIIPSGWSVEQRRIAGILLSNAVVQASWPPAHISVAQQVTVQDAITSALSPTGKAQPTAEILITFASNVGEGTVAEWAADGTLFTASNPLGAIPGEGAVGLLAATPAVASSLATACVLMHPIEAAQRDPGKKEDVTGLEELVGRTLKQAGADISKVAMIVADTGHQPSRASELMICANKAMPQIDATEDVVHAGFACAACGQVPLMTALALACHHAQERMASVLVIGNDDPSRRLGAVISPSAGSLG